MIWDLLYCVMSAMQPTKKNSWIGYMELSGLSLPKVFQGI
ncbi:hypothetical protein NMBG2136_0592 [Neisseria meningitidis G2136]|nr:hypothetical protein NMBG2136_0592 [Neisseria meningitidis G2136]EGC64344.1 hypothetical protein NMB9615945_1509 [Neisseria meningitidis 961-5945]CWP05524.1 Uncharacterised protein [Neisseria meningitidis]